METGVATPNTIKEFAKAEAVDFSTPSRKEWEEMSLDDAHKLVQKFQSAYQEGATILNQRVYNTQRETGTFVCIVCKKKKPLTVGDGTSARPNYIWRSDDRDPKTGILTSRYICSQDCHFRGSNSNRVSK